MVTDDNHMRPSMLETVDTFVEEVSWGTARKVLVYRREHGGRIFIRLRTWLRHQELGVWYPGRRFFVIPEVNGCELADAIDNAVCCNLSDKPDWLVERERIEEAVLEEAIGPNIPTDPVERSKLLAQLRRKKH